MAKNIFEKRRKLIQQSYKKKNYARNAKSGRNYYRYNKEKTGIRITKDIPIMK
jgi:hypothetical protein